MIDRVMLNFKRKDKIRTQVLEQRFKKCNLNAVQQSRRNKWSWAGHIARIDKKINELTK